MLVFDHLNSSLPALFNDLFKSFNEQHSHNTRGARRYVLKSQKWKRLFMVPDQFRLRDCRQITFVMFNGFCPLSKKAPPPVLNGQYQNAENTN